MSVIRLLLPPGEHVSVYQSIHQSVSQSVARHLTESPGKEEGDGVPLQRQGETRMRSG